MGDNLHKINFRASKILTCVESTIKITSSTILKNAQNRTKICEKARNFLHNSIYFMKNSERASWTASSQN